MSSRESGRRKVPRLISKRTEERLPVEIDEGSRIPLFLRRLMYTSLSTKAHLYLSFLGLSGSSWIGRLKLDLEGSELNFPFLILGKMIRLIRDGYPVPTGLYQ